MTALFRRLRSSSLNRKYPIHLCHILNSNFKIFKQPWDFELRLPRASHLW